MTGAAYIPIDATYPDARITQFLADKDFAQQCFVFSEPVAAKHKGADTKVFLIADSGYNPYTGVVITFVAVLSIGEGSEIFKLGNDKE